MKWRKRTTCSPGSEELGRHDPQGNWIPEGELTIRFWTGFAVGFGLALALAPFFLWYFRKSF